MKLERARTFNWYNLIDCNNNLFKCILPHWLPILERKIWTDLYNLLARWEEVEDKKIKEPIEKYNIF